MLPSFQIPYMHEKMVSNLLSFNGMEMNWTYTYRFYQPFTNIHGFPGFSGNGQTCANGENQTAFSPPTWPGNEARLGNNFILT